MFAILIADENVELLSEFQIEHDIPVDHVLSYLICKSEWFLVRGWQSPRGGLKVWTCLPGYIIRENYEFDPEKIKTEWDQIVRK